MWDDQRTRRKRTRLSRIGGKRQENLYALARNNILKVKSLCFSSVEMGFYSPIIMSTCYIIALDHK